MNTSISICTVRGQTARVGTNPGNFTIPDVPVCAGDNDLQVTVRDVSGNTATQTRLMSRPMDETFRYDGNGNLTNWVSGTTNWVYEWDWADRFTKVSSNGITVLENWYDAGSRRLAKKDAAYALYLLDGWESVAVLNQSGVAQEIFTRGVGIAGDIGTLVAITKLSTPAIYYAHHNHRGDVTTVRNGANTVSGYSYSAFGLQTSAFGSDVSRFKFSSKEREASTGWSYYGHRFYAPQWQRWVSRDKLAEAHHGKIYEFCNNSPLCHIDPNGHFAIAIPIIAIGIEVIKDLVFVGSAVIAGVAVHAMCKTKPAPNPNVETCDLYGPATGSTCTYWCKRSQRFVDLPGHPEGCPSQWTGDPYHPGN